MQRKMVIHLNKTDNNRFTKPTVCNKPKGHEDTRRTFINKVMKSGQVSA
jgi:hypothetical protein